MNTPRIRTRHRLATLVAVVLLLPGSVSLAQEPAVVRITDRLEPAQLEVSPGTSVTWRNEDDERHRVRSREGPEEFDSGDLEPGEGFTFTFSVAGSYPYIDERDDEDPDYHGTIVVSAGGMTDVAGSPPASGAVTIIDESFAPPALEVVTGGTVTWTNQDGDDRHTVTADDGSFDSGILEGGATFSRAFAAPGTFDYTCLIHPEMRGTVTVTGDGVAVAPSVMPSASASASLETSASASPSSSASPSASPSSAASPSASPAAAASGAEPVTMLGRAFQPGTVEVAVGGTVDWLNDDGEGHTVTALDGTFNSGVIGVGDAFAWTFEEPGTIDYLCAIHPEMRGTVTVTE